MIHLGDITQIKGNEVPIVDIITGGSPCQDISVAGKRAGLDGERSGLFMEQIRIIKEMREYDKRTNSRTDIDVRPRYMVWENVPGAFSSNKGDDFRCVLEETAKIADKDATIPRPEGGKWSKAGCVVGDGWSLAWRVHDAQFWGVLQRRKRICLLADFNGNTAPEILFELLRETDEGNEDETIMGVRTDTRYEIQPLSESLRRDTEKSGEERQAASRDVGEGSSETISFQERAGKPGGGKGILIQNERTGALSTLNNQSVLQTKCLNPWDVQSKHIQPEDGIAEALYSGECRYGGGESYVMQKVIENHPADSRVKVNDDGIVQTLSSRMGTGGGNVPMILKQEPITTSHGGFMVNADDSGIAHSLEASDYKDPQMVAYGLDRAAYNQGKNAKFNFSIEEEKIGDQVAKGPGAVFQSVVRRLTPLECERLQGYPDGWTDIGEWTDGKGKKRKNSDAPRYKALGNSIALPFWRWLAERITETYSRRTTMASLFDGIGGFPLVFSQFGCEPIWASEIEDFPIAVTKKRFGEK